MGGHVPEGDKVDQQKEAAVEVGCASRSSAGEFPTLPALTSLDQCANLHCSSSSVLYVMLVSFLVRRGG